MTKRKITTKALIAFMLAFTLFLTSFSMPVMADDPPVQPAEYFVTVNLGNGNIGGDTGPITLGPFSAGDTVGGQLGTPFREGFNFTGWSDGFSSSTQINGNINISAIWEAIVVTPPPVTVTFQPGFAGGSTFTRTTAQGTTLGTNFPSDPQRTGYTFVRWQIASSTTDFHQNSIVNGDITVIAQWSANTATVTFNPAQGTISGGHTRVVNVNQTLSNAGHTMPTATRTGHTFDRWQMPNGNAFNATTPVTGDMTVTAVWTTNNRARVNFNLNGGNINGNTQNPHTYVNIGGTINNTPDASLPTQPTRTGYTFDGWRLNNAAFTGTTQVNNSITVIANWTSGNQATITFDLDGGTIGGSSANQTRIVNRGQSIQNAPGVNMPSAPTRQGFTFVRWELSDGTVFAANTVVDENTTVYAQWVSGDRLIVTFDLNNGRIGSGNSGLINPFRAVNRNQSINNTSGVSMPANPTRQGFTFNGWQMANGNEFTATTNVNANMTVTAQWVSGNQATVTFNLAGGTIGNNDTNPTRVVNIGQSINNTSGVSMPANPTRQGFTFAGWQMANNNPFTATTVVNSNITVTAQWTSGNQATVTFSLNGGAIGTITENQTRDIPIGQTIANTAGITLPPNPTRQGFVFNGWHMAGGVAFNANTVVNNSFTVTAQWTFPTAQNRAPLVNQVVTLNEHGVITLGGYVVNLPSDLGSFHINSNGVSVLPARAVLSVLFGADPHDPHLFVWYADISTFVIDPQGHNIRIQVDNQTMFVGGMPRTIMSGTGDAAFPYAAYVDPRDSRMYAPVRAIAEAVGFTVQWDAATSTVTLVPPGV